MSNHPQETSKGSQRPPQPPEMASQNIFIPFITDKHRLYISADTVTGKIVEVLRHPTAEDREQGVRQLIQIPRADYWKYLNATELQSIQRVIEEYQKNTNRSD